MTCAEKCINSRGHLGMQKAHSLVAFKLLRCLLADVDLCCFPLRGTVSMQSFSLGFVRLAPVNKLTRNLELQLFQGHLMLLTEWACHTNSYIMLEPGPPFLKYQNKNKTILRCGIEITYPFPNFNGQCNLEVSKWTCYSIPHFIPHVITYPRWDKSWTTLVKGATKSAWVRTQQCLYWCPGANSAGHHQPHNWTNTKALVKFQTNSDIYNLLRSGSMSLLCIINVRGHECPQWWPPFKFSLISSSNTFHSGRNFLPLVSS